MLHVNFNHSILSKLFSSVYKVFKFRQVMQMSYSCLLLEINFFIMVFGNIKKKVVK